MSSRENKPLTTVVITLARNNTPPSSNHHLLSAGVAIAALLALVVIFESNNITGDFVAVKGNTNTMTFKETRDIKPNCPESDINCHRIDCRSQEGDDNFQLCGKCPRGNPADPKALTGKCCLPTSGDYHCETFREYLWYSTRQSLATLCSPTQGVCWT